MEHIANDAFVLGGHTFESRFILGSGKYSLELIQEAAKTASILSFLILMMLHAFHDIINVVHVDFHCRSVNIMLVS